MHRIEVPTYLASEMHAYPVTMHLPGVTWGWETIPGPKKVAFRPCNEGGLDRPFHELHDEILRWYDHWLKGIDTGLMDEPAVKIWVRGAERWRYAEEWPLLAETDWTKLYLRAGGRLDGAPPDGEESPDRLAYEPAVPVVIGGTPLNPEPEHLAWTTDAFDEDVELIGPLALRLHATLSEKDGDFLVAVKDVDADGAEVVLTRGWLRASHREVDPERSQPWKPFHPHERPAPVTPGRAEEYAIEIQPLASLFPRGHRLKLELWPCDYPTEPYDWTQYWGACHHMPYGLAVDYEIHHSAERQSHLLVPVMRSPTP
jgi:putative CocE/NonD family hydrolase